MKIKSYKAQVLILFTVSVIIRFFISDFPKVMRVYPDELRYLEIARSLMQQHQILMDGTSTDFQKILYSLCISPAFLFSSTLVQIKVATFLNTIIMSSAVFPAYLLMERMLHSISNRAKLFLLIIVVTAPTMFYTFTFMSEVIFYPLSLWMAYAAWLLFDEKMLKRKAILSVIWGVLCYLAYLNKEIALYFLLAYCLVTVLGFIKKQNRQAKGTDLLCLCVSILTFLVCFALMKVTIFRGYGNSYHQMGLDAIMTPYNFLYCVYAFIILLIFSILAAGIFTILFSVADIGEQEDNAGRQYNLWLLLSLLIGCAAIAYTISVREDLGQRSPRLHLRYLEPLFILFMIQMTGRLQGNRDLTHHPKRRRRLLGLVISYLILFMLFAYQVLYGVFVDQQSLRYYQVFTFTTFRISGYDIPPDFMAQFVKIMITVCIVILLYFYMHHGRSFWKVYLWAFLFVNVINSIGSWFILRREYVYTAAAAEQAAQANDFCRSLDGNLLIITDLPLFDKGNCLFDTYFDADIYQTSMDRINEQAYLSDACIDLSTELLQSRTIGAAYDDLKAVDYFICPAHILPDEDKAVLVEGFKLDGYRLYQNIDTSKLFLN